jgi:hypothetical protein
MRRLHHTLICLLVTGAAALQVLGGELSSSAKRQGTLDLAGRLLAPRKNPAAQLPESLVNPFSPESKAAKNSDGANSGRPPGSLDREILAKIASSVTPSGMMMFGGQPLLLFHEKKLKVGDNLKINFEGVEYVVIITAIEATSFRLSLNQEEIIRPIKPGKTR